LTQGVSRGDLDIEGSEDPYGQIRWAAALDELDQRVQVIP
jgi:hypothetical protein